MNFSIESRDIFGVTLGQSVDKTSDACLSLDSEEIFKSYPVVLKIKNLIPADIGATYSFKLKTKVSKI